MSAFLPRRTYMSVLHSRVGRCLYRRSRKVNVEPLKAASAIERQANLLARLLSKGAVRSICFLCPLL